MCNRSRILLAGALAVLAMSTAVGGASANRFSTNETRWRHVWTPLRFVAGSATVSCNLTLEGSFHSSTSAKVRGALAGFITRASIASCVGGSSTVLVETLPWHVHYTSFQGTLPRITAVSNELTGTGFSTQPSGSLKCLARMTAEHPGRSITSINESGAVTAITADRTASIPLTGEGGLCVFAGEFHFEGTGVITRLGTTGLITIRLI